ncbi:two-pore potassium channel 1 [Malania oleifera]|uniref:two-pore potassium channel 1 n=1 Tax=Malania oleifera TaxID=397392 RepID=UPI0025ADFFE1|nr:two-pore potassium channel 1 [Malania oleifera]XP_057969837.1 two-pore potassium channel 1 [Malania oleifera]
MAPNGGRHSLLSGLLDPAPQTSKKPAPKRKYRRCKSAPTAEYVPPQVNGTGSLPPSVSILGKLHPSFRQVATFLAVYLGVGTICFYFIRHQIKGKKTNGILDAIYFCIVTMTTVGYGDLVPNSVPTKLLACAFVFTGMALIGLILTKAADYLVEKQERLTVKALHQLHMDGQREILEEIEPNRVRHKCFVVLIVLLVLMITGTIFLCSVENLDFVDAFYCVCSTITTLGYGDKSFSTKAGRVFAIVWILTSTICLAQFFLYLAELKTESRRRSLVKWVLTRRMTNVDLEAADLDDDGVVSVAEFIIYKLREMDKISQEDISLVIEEFEDLDVDQSGTLSVSDIMLAQSS